MTRLGLAIATAFTPFAATLPLSGQTPPRPSWIITAHAVDGDGGPAQSLKAHLERVGGFDAKGVCFFTACLNFPRLHYTGSQGTVAVGHTLGPRLGVRALVRWGSLGGVTGEGDSGTIAWHWSAIAVGAQLTFDLPPSQWLKHAAFGASFGAGPVMAWVRSGRGVPGAYPPDSNSHFTRL